MVVYGFAFPGVRTGVGQKCCHHPPVADIPAQQKEQATSHECQAPEVWKEHEAGEMEEEARTKINAFL